MLEEEDEDKEICEFLVGLGYPRSALSLKNGDVEEDFLPILADEASNNGGIPDILRKLAISFGSEQLDNCGLLEIVVDLGNLPKDLRDKLGRNF